MRPRVLGLVTATTLLVFAALASSAAASVRVYVSPSIGKPTTHFVVRFRAPSETGLTLHRRYELYASATKGSRCTSSVADAIGATSVGSHVRVTLKPARTGGRWCTGKFRGRIVEYISTVCQPTNAAIVCPDIVIAPQTIARFTFRVNRSTGSSSGTGTGTGTQTGTPTFAGLKSATECIPTTPKAEPAEHSVQLSWNPATDPTTPSSAIVYDIYYSTTSGAENFSSPSWTSSPGATSDTVTVSGGGPAYFVVRARDAAGHEDDNTVQLAAVNTCTNA